jgi:hypothetical protein
MSLICFQERARSCSESLLNWKFLLMYREVFLVMAKDPIESLQIAETVSDNSSVKLLNVMSAQLPGVPKSIPCPDNACWIS